MGFHACHMAFQTRHSFRFIRCVAVILERRQTHFRVNDHIPLRIQMQNEVRTEITRLAVFVTVLDIYLRVILHTFPQTLVFQQLLTLTLSPVALILRIMCQRTRQLVRRLRRQCRLLQQMLDLFLHRRLQFRLRNATVGHRLLHMRQVCLQRLQ